MSAARGGRTGDAPTRRESSGFTLMEVLAAVFLTSIVIGLGVTALMVAMAIRLYEKYRTFDTNEIRRLRG